MCELLAGDNAFKGKDKSEVLKKIMQEDFLNNINFPDYIAPEAIDLVRQLLQINPLKRLGSDAQNGRPNLSPLKSHKFFKNFNFADLKAGKWSR